MTDQPRCRWDREFSEYLLPDAKPCLVDDYGDPTRHCTARRTCSQHVGPGELTCARCLGRTRMDVRQIVGLAALMLPEAIAVGVDSEAANLAGPAADVEAWSWRKVAAMQGRAWHLSMVEDDDDWHPYTVITRWAHMLSEDYESQRPETWTVTNAAAYLDRILSRVAQDDEQDFGLLAREMRKCRTHLENVRRDGQAPERGAPCPECKADEKLIRLVREYAHWCEDPDCEKFHHDTDEADVWRCPRKPDEHWWDVVAYSKYVEERMGA